MENNVHFCRVVTICYAEFTSVLPPTKPRLLFFFFLGGGGVPYIYIYIHIYVYIESLEASLCECACDVCLLMKIVYVHT